MTAKLVQWIIVKDSFVRLKPFHWIYYCTVTSFTNPTYSYPVDFSKKNKERRQQNREKNERKRNQDFRKKKFCMVISQSCHFAQLSGRGFPSRLGDFQKFYNESQMDYYYAVFFFFLNIRMIFFLHAKIWCRKWTENENCPAWYSQFKEFLQAIYSFYKLR